MSTERQEPFGPLGARGEDPEIDVKATEQAFYPDDHPTEGGIRKFSETVIEAVENFGMKVGEGARHISDHWKEDGTSMASALFGTGE